MHIVLMRHAVAAAHDPERWPDDMARPLTPRGVQRARRAAAGVVRLSPRLARVISSPAARCLETARQLAAQAGLGGPVVVSDALAPLAGRTDALRLLASEPADGVIAFVGHDPGLSRLAAMLLGAPVRAFAFKKAGACCLDWSPPRAGGARLVWWLPPAALRRLRRGRRRVA